MKKIKIEVIITLVICLFGLNSCIQNTPKNNQLKFTTNTNVLTKINEQEVIMSNEDYELFYEIVDSLSWKRKDELTTELCEYEISSCRTLEEDEGKLINQKYQEFSCLYKVSTLSKYVILECMPVAIHNAYKESLYATFDDEILEKINTIFDNYQSFQYTSTFTFGKSSVEGLKYKLTYYQTSDDSFFDIVDKINWVDVPMYDIVSENTKMIAMPDTFLVQTSRELFKENDEDFRSTVYSVEYMIDLNTNYAQAFILSPIYVSAIHLTAIFEADISEYTDEFYNYFKEIAPVHKVEVNNNLNMDYSISKKYAFEGEEITAYITMPVGFDENTQKIVMYVNDDKYEEDSIVKSCYKFAMSNSDVTINFKIVAKEKIND